MKAERQDEGHTRTVTGRVHGQQVDQNRCTCRINPECHPPAMGIRRFNEDLLKARYLTEAMQETQEIPSSNPFPHQSTLTTSAASMNASARNQSVAPQMMYRRSIPWPLSENDDIALAQPHIQVQDHVRTKDVARTESEPRIPTYTRNAVAGSLLHSSGNTKSKKGIYLDIGAGLDAGIKRRGSPNEDSLLAIENFTRLVAAPQPVGLCIVADGMGGHGNGREASQLAIRAMRESVLMALRLGVEEDETLMEVLVEGCTVQTTACTNATSSS